MEISKDQLKSFISLYQTELGISLSMVEAQQKALSLIRFTATSIKPFEGKLENDIIELPDSNKQHEEFASGEGQR